MILYSVTIYMSIKKHWSKVVVSILVKIVVLSTEHIGNLKVHKMVKNNPLCPPEFFFDTPVPIEKVGIS